MPLKQVLLSPEAIKHIEDIKKEYSDFTLTDLDCIEIALTFFVGKEYLRKRD